MGLIFLLFVFFFQIVSHIVLNTDSFSMNGLTKS